MKKIIIFFLVSILFIFPSKYTLNAAEIPDPDLTSARANVYDYIIVIDESGSMKGNDPSNLRIDAAKLFIYLSEILNRGNRVLIAGFGEKTNIYMPLTEISGNEEKISGAIGQIQGNQKYTDMKGALTEIKLTLDERKDKRKTAVIFLTDGALTIDDIPPQSSGQSAGKTGQEKPGRSKGGENTQDQPEGPVTSTEESTGKNTDTQSQSQYLEQYKKDLLDLCYLYKKDNISIYPIAFTKEAEVQLLQKMASITNGASWKAESASDIRNIFIEILKNITSRFIRIEDQKDNSPIAGQINLKDYIKEFVVLALKNNTGSGLSINLTDPAGKEPAYDTKVDNSAFKIVKVTHPQTGKWSYNVKGDAVFIYEILNSSIIEPRDSLYLTGTEIPLEIKLGETTAEDFKISAMVENPAGEVENNIPLADDGSGSDEIKNDGIFSGVLERVNSNGNYSAQFDILNTSTNAEALKKINFEVVKLPAEFEVLEPVNNVYMINTKIPVKVQLKQITGGANINFNDFQIFFNIRYPDGKVSEDLSMQDNGSGIDEAAGDGIFSYSIDNSALEGNYRLEFFIQHIPTMTIAANAGKKIDFKVSKSSEIILNIKNNLITGTPTSITANFTDFSSSNFIYKLTKPDGTILQGNLKDDGLEISSDMKKDDGIYSASLDGLSLDQMGEYKINVEGTYGGSSAETGNVLTSGGKFEKNYKIEGPQEIFKITDLSKLQEFGFKVTSKNTSDSKITINPQAFTSNEFFASAEIEGNTQTVKANSENNLKLKVKLKDNLEQDKFTIIIPLQISEDDGKTVNEININIMLEVEQRQGYPSYLIFILIGAAVLAIAGIIVFVYFLFIRPRKRGY